MLTTRLLKSRSDRQHSKREDSRRTGNRDAAVFLFAEGRRAAAPQAFLQKKEKGTAKNEAAFLAVPFGNDDRFRVKRMFQRTLSEQERSL